LVGAESVRRFGLITTNSLRQAFNRRVVEAHLKNDEVPVSLVFAVPDHPWVDTADGAAVRISMTVGQGGKNLGQLLEVAEQGPQPSGEAIVELAGNRGIINPDLSIGVDVGSAVRLVANKGIA